MSTSAASKDVDPDLFSDSGFESEESERVVEKITKEDANAGQAGVGHLSEQRPVPLTFSEQAEQAYINYVAQNPVPTVYLPAYPGPAGALGYPPPVVCYPTYTRPAGSLPDGTIAYPNYYAAPIPPMSKTIPSRTAIPDVGSVISRTNSPEGSPGPQVRTRAPGKTAIACTFCRRRKIKCDGGRPQCHMCWKNSENCVYDKELRRRGLGRKSILEAQGISIEDTAPRRVRKRTLAPAKPSTDSATAENPPADESVAVSKSPAGPPLAPIPLLAPSAQLMPLPATDSASYGHVPAVERPDLTATAIINALNIAYTGQNFVPYPLMHPSIQRAPPVPAANANETTTTVQTKAPASRSRKRKAQGESPAEPTSRKRGRQD